MMMNATNGRSRERVTLYMDRGTEDDFGNRQSSEMVISTDTDPMKPIRSHPLNSLFHSTVLT